VDEPVLIVRLDVPEALGTVDGAKLQFAPLGRPAHESATAALNPPTGVTVTVDVAELPGTTVAGENARAEIRKSGVGALDVFSSVITTLFEFVVRATARSGRLSRLKSATRVKLYEYRG